MSGIGFWLLVYILGMVLAGVVATRRTQSQTDYFLAGRSLGPKVAAISSMSAAFSGFVFLGGPGLAYRIGLLSWFIVLPVAWTAVLLVARAAGPLRKLADQGALTLPEALGLRFRSKTVQAVAAVWLIVGCLTYVAVQFRAMAILLTTWYPQLNVSHAVWVCTAAIGLYAVIGGMKAAVWTDLWQGAWMLVAALAIGFAAISAILHADFSFAAIGSSAEFSELFFDPLHETTIFTAIGFLFLFGVGVLGQPQTITKFLMVRTDANLKTFPRWFAGSQLACLAVWFGVGCVVPVWVATGRLTPLADPDRATTVFLAAAFPDWLAGFVFVAALCAVMSTVDSFLNIAAAAVVRDFPTACGLPAPVSLLLPRLASMFLAVIAALLAIYESGPLALLGTAAFGVFAATFAPLVALALRQPALPPRFTVILMFLGGGMSVLLEFLRRQPAQWEALPAALTRLPPSGTALLMAFTVLLLRLIFSPKY